MTKPILRIYRKFAKIPVGQTFNELTVLSRAPQRNRKKGTVIWYCRCSCGREAEVPSDNVRNGHTKSCGHLVGKPDEQHGRWGCPEYKIWDAMIQRCTNPNSTRYADYGGRGICVCDRWRQSFSAFAEDMGDRPSRRHSLERLNNDGMYEPGNVVWATMHRQSRNKRTNRYIERNGVKKTVVDWADEAGMPRHVLQGRVKLGWDFDRALSEPVELHVRPVLQIDPVTGQEVARFSSMVEAEKATGASRMNISTVCRKASKRKMVGGFKWRFADDPV